MIQLEVKESFDIEEGKHKAEIVDIKERKEPYHYIDIYFRLEDGGTIKNGYPASISEKSALGRLLGRLDVHTEVGTKIDLEEALLGKKVELMTMDEETDQGTFARVVKGSVKPA